MFTWFDFKPNEYNFKVFQLPLDPGTRGYMHRYVREYKSAATAAVPPALRIATLVLSIAAVLR